MSHLDCEDGTVIVWVPISCYEATDPIVSQGTVFLTGVTLSGAAREWLYENATSRVGIVELPEVVAVHFDDPNEAFAFKVRWA